MRVIIYIFLCRAYFSAKTSIAQPAYPSTLVSPPPPTRSCVGGRDFFWELALQRAESVRAGIQCTARTITFYICINSLSDVSSGFRRNLQSSARSRFTLGNGRQKRQTESEKTLVPTRVLLLSCIRSPYTNGRTTCLLSLSRECFLTTRPIDVEFWIDVCL